MKRFFSALGRGLLYVLLFVGVQMIVSMNALIAYAIFAVTKGVLSGGFDYYSISQTLMDFLVKYNNLLSVISAAVTILLLWLIFKTRKRKLLPEIHLTVPRHWVSLVPAAVAGVAMAVAVSYGISLLPIPEYLLESYGEASGMLGGGNVIIGFIATVIAAPIVEETVLRGLVYTRFKQGMPLVVAMLLESAIFGAIHGNLLWIAYAFVLGVVLTLVFEGTGTILGSIAFHMAFNLVGTYVTPYLETADRIVMYAALALALAVTVSCGVWINSLRKQHGEKREPFRLKELVEFEPDVTDEEPGAEPADEPADEPTEDE